MIALLVGCSPAPVDPSTAPTWVDVAPVLEDRCVACHHTDGIGPFSVETHAEAASWAAPIADAASSRRMPPFLADNSGACGTFETHDWLADDEIQLLQGWADAGAPGGDASDPTPAAPEALQGARTLDIGVDYTPATSPDDYRCFVVDPGLDHDQFLTAFQVVPGDPGIVHHVIVYTLDTETSESAADALDALDAEPGYTCFGSSLAPDSRPIAAWAPGTPITRLPDEAGIRLTAGHRLVLQVHYNCPPTSSCGNTTAGTRTDRTSVELSLADGVVREALVVLLTDLAMVLPPGEPDTTHTWELPLGQLGLPLGAFVRGVFPHMHLRGRTLRLEVVSASDGSTRCAIDVPRWDFAWQQLYFYQEPLYVDPDDTLRLTCTYDMSGDDAEVSWGEGTADEMCLVGLLATFG